MGPHPFLERPSQTFKTSKQAGKQASTSKKPQSHINFGERLQKFKASKQVTRKSHKTTPFLERPSQTFKTSKQAGKQASTSKKPQNHINFGERLKKFKASKQLTR